MSNILHMQQNLIDIQERINREVTFGEDTARELLKTVSLLKETTAMLEKQIITLFQDRRASLMATLGQPQETMTLVHEAEPAKAKLKVAE
jgi:hypothetical protein